MDGGVRRASQHGRSQRLLLVQSLRLPQLQDLAVVQSVHFVLEELQRGGLAGQRPGDLLPHHLHHLQTEKGQRSAGHASGETRMSGKEMW